MDPKKEQDSGEDSGEEGSEQTTQTSVKVPISESVPEQHTQAANTEQAVTSSNKLIDSTTQTTANSLAGACGTRDGQLPNSPRDKKQKVHTPSSTTGRPSNAAQNFMVAASPPKFVSVEEIMKAANGVSNMRLAHEIAVDEDFRFNKPEEPEDSLEQRVHEVVHRAFWDSLQEKLREDPPDYSQALVLLQDIKEMLEAVLMPHHQRIRNMINEVLDLDLIEQQANNGVLDVLHYADFVISIMARLCAPARDEEIEKLQSIREIVPLFQELLRVLELMKMDMANFTVQQVRPFIQQQSVMFERKKFEDFLKQQEENGIDGLRWTKAWLMRSAEALTPVGNVPSTSEVVAANLLATPAAILNNAYLQLLQWIPEDTFPETLLMDEERFYEIRCQVRWLAQISAILLVTYSTVGGPISGIAGLKAKLCDEISSILAGVAFSEINKVMPQVAEHVTNVVGQIVVDHGYPVMTTETETMLKGQIVSVSDQQHAVHKLMKKRVLDFVLGVLSDSQQKDLKIPNGFSAVSEELSHTCGRFLRLVSHNRSVFGLHYANIIGMILKRHADASPMPSPEVSPR